MPEIKRPVRASEYGDIYDADECCIADAGYEDQAAEIAHWLNSKDEVEVAIHELSKAIDPGNWGMVYQVRDRLRKLLNGGE